VTPTWTAAVIAAKTNPTSVQPAQRVAGVDTTELRWFAGGRLPAGVAAWFAHDGAVGVREERCDKYRLDGRRDRGIKLRAGRTLELKIRQSLGQRLTVGAGLTGQVEAWRKWSPADSLVECNASLTMVDVHKTVTKRRFSVGGDECASAGDAALPAAGGVDVEVVAITVEGVESWTFAFSAFGPGASRCGAIVSASQALFAGTRVPEIGFLLGRSSSYPSWLVDVASPRKCVTEPTASPRFLGRPIRP
jgi:hypothetical protein